MNLLNALKKSEYITRPDFGLNDYIRIHPNLGIADDGGNPYTLTYSDLTSLDWIPYQESLLITIKENITNKAIDYIYINKIDLETMTVENALSILAIIELEETI